MKNISIYLSIVIPSLAALSCKDEAIYEPIGSIVVSSTVTIGIKSESGMDLLDPNLPNSLKHFKVYYLRGGIKKLYYHPWIDASGSYLIEKYSIRSWYHIKLLLDIPKLDESKTGDWTTTYLEFEDGSMDTITAQYTIKRGLIVIDRASYNGVQFFDRFQDYSHVPSYEVVK